MTSGPRDDLEPLLEATLNRCCFEERLDDDPVGLVRPYGRPEDREVAALIASCLAYGRVDLLRPAITEALEPLGAHPATFLRRTPKASIKELWPDFTYRMTRGADLRDLAWSIAVTLRSEGSLQALYRAPCDGELPIDDIDTHLRCASSWIETLRERRLRPTVERGFRYLLVDPADGSACKRLHLFFRWVVRGPGPVDMGIWDCVTPASLLMPLDTHTSRLCRYLGILDRKSVDGKAARLVSEHLLQYDGDDPLRYDFALCHLGISQRCIHRRCPDRCPECPIEPACVLPGESEE